MLTVDESNSCFLSHSDDIMQLGLASFVADFLLQKFCTKCRSNVHHFLGRDLVALGGRRSGRCGRCSLWLRENEDQTRGFSNF
jgi:hypothetical protein